MLQEYYDYRKKKIVNRIFMYYKRKLLLIRFFLCRHGEHGEL